MLVVASTLLFVTNHAKVAEPRATAATRTMAMAAPICFFNALVSMRTPFFPHSSQMTLEKPGRGARAFVLDVACPSFRYGIENTIILTISL